MNNEKIMLVLPNNGSSEGNFYKDKKNCSVNFGGAIRLVTNVRVTYDYVIVDFE